MVTITLYLLVYSSSFFSLLRSLVILSLGFLIVKKKKKRPNNHHHHHHHHQTQNHPNTINTTRQITTPYNPNTKSTHNLQKIKSKSTKNQQKSKPNSTKNHKSTSPQPKKPISPQLKKTHVSWLLLLIRSKEWVANQDWRIKRVKLLREREREREREEITYRKMREQRDER